MVIFFTATRLPRGMVMTLCPGSGVMAWTLAYLAVLTEKDRVIVSPLSVSTVTLPS